MAWAHAGDLKHNHIHIFVVSFFLINILTLWEYISYRGNMIWIQDNFPDFFLIHLHKERDSEKKKELLFMIKFPIEKERLIHNGSSMCPPNAKSSFQLNQIWPLPWRSPDNFYPASDGGYRLIRIPSIMVLQLGNLFASCLSYQTVMFLGAIDISYLSSYSLFYLKSLARWCNSK